MTLGADGQHVIVKVEVDILLIEAGQIRLKGVAVAIVLDIRLELFKGGLKERRIEEVPFKL